MTVSSEDGIQQYVGSGSTGPFPITEFTISAANAIKVIRTVISTGVETELTLNAGTDGFTVNSDLDEVTLTESVDSTYRITLMLDEPYTQASEYTVNDLFPAKRTERALDKLTRIAIQLKDRVDKCLRFADSSTASSQLVPDPSEGKVLGWDADGDLVNLTPNSDTYITLPTPSDGDAIGWDSSGDLVNVTVPSVSSFAETLLDDTTAAAARTTLGAAASGANSDITSLTGLTTGLARSGANGVDCKNNTGTPNTQYDLDANEITLVNSSGGTVLVVNPGTALTNNVSTAGPAANGRDQSGAFSAGSWVHFYWIWGAGTLATLSSASAPPTAPTLPSGYTHYCYAGSVYFNGSSQLANTVIKGSWIYYKTPTSVLAAGTATSETSIALTAAIPPIATQAIAWVQIGTTGNSTQNLNTIKLRVLTSVDFQIYTERALTAYAGTSDYQFMFPNIGQNLYYLLSKLSDGTFASTIKIQGYQVPNNGG